MREPMQSRPRLFLTFAGDDLALARPVAAQLRRIRGRLRPRLRRAQRAVRRPEVRPHPREPRAARSSAAPPPCACSAPTPSTTTGCAGPSRWRESYASPCSVRRSPPASAGVADLLASIGAEIVPLRGEAIAERLARRPILGRARAAHGRVAGRRAADDEAPTALTRSARRASRAAEAVDAAPSADRARGVDRRLPRVSPLRRVRATTTRSLPCRPWPRTARRRRAR